MKLFTVRFRLFIAVLTFGLSVVAAHGQWSVVDSLSQPYRLDYLGNKYLYSPSGVTRTSFDGVVTDRFDRKLYGHLTQVDISNPLKLVLFYQEQSRVVLLDKNLGEIALLDLEVFGMDQVVYAVNASQGGCWLFDLANFELLRISRTGEIFQRSGNLAGLVKGRVDVDFLKEFNGKVYLHLKSDGWLIFDTMGNFIRQATVVNHEMPIALIPGGFLYYSNGALHQYSWRDYQTKEVLVCQDIPSEIMWVQDRIVLIYTNHSKILSLKE